MGKSIRSLSIDKTSHNPTAHTVLKTCSALTKSEAPCSAGDWGGHLALRLRVPLSKAWEQHPSGCTRACRTNASQTLLSPRFSAGVKRAAASLYQGKLPGSQCAEVPAGTSQPLGGTACLDPSSCKGGRGIT